MNHNRTVGLFVLYALFTATSAIGQQVADDNSTKISIEAQRLDLALNELAQQSGFQLLTFSEDALDKTAKSLNGILSDEQALDLLLEGTGLTYREVEEDVIAVGSPDRLSAKFPGNARPASNPALVAQSRISTESRKLPTRVPANASSSTNDDNATSVVTGKVTDARTGANLRGAKVTIEETGQWTSTNDRGRFRFSGLESGEYTLTVSNLGYTRQSAVVRVRDHRVLQDFALRGGSEIEEIVVFGQRSARAQALNIERTTENFTTVISSDLLGQFEGATLADTLRRAPGIAFQEDPLTGDGTNVIVRGLAPDLNQVRFNGVRLAEPTGIGRSPAIGNILTDSISSVTINKTLLPNQDSSGTGGLIEIETVGPLDRDSRFMSFSAETEFNEDFQETYQLGGTASASFGSSTPFGVSLSLQYRDLENQTVGYGYGISNFGQYLPLDESGDPIRRSSSISPLLSFPFEEGVNDVYPNGLDSELNDAESKIFSGTFTLEWEPADHTNLELAFTHVDQDNRSTQSFVGFQPVSAYRRQPIAELGGEERFALITEDVLLAAGFGGILAEVKHELVDRESSIETDILSFSGTTELSRLTFRYGAGFSNGSTTTDANTWQFVNSPTGPFGTLQVPVSFLNGQAQANTINGLIVSAFDVRRPGFEGYQPILLSAEGEAFLNDPANYVVGDDSNGRINRSSTFGENERRSLRSSMRYSFDQSSLDYLEIGFEYETARFDREVQPIERYGFTSNGLSLVDIGIRAFDGNNLDAIGVDAGLASASAQDLRSLFANLDQLTTGSTPLLVRTVDDPSPFDDPGTFTDEEELAAYLQGSITLGDVQIVAGGRFSRYDISARVLTAPRLRLANGDTDFEFEEQFRILIDETASQTRFLPRFVINYRPDDNLVFRGGYFQSIARPDVNSLSRRQNVSLDLRPLFGPDRDQPRLSVSQGNPDLKPTLTHSYDLSVEYYNDNAGVISASIFYKELQNFLEFSSTSTLNPDDIAGITLPNDPRFAALPENTFLQVTQPTNNDFPAKIWGLELNFEHQFVALPGPWNGLGVYSNYTYTDSEKFFVFEDILDQNTGEFVDVSRDGVPFDQSPQHSGTIAVTYQKYGIEGSLAYTAQSERLRSFRGNNLSEYNASDDSLDLRIEYNFDAYRSNLSAFIAGSDLLKSAHDPDTLHFMGESGDTGRYYTDGTFFGGRTVSLGIRVVF